MIALLICTVVSLASVPPSGLSNQDDWKLRVVPTKEVFAPWDPVILVIEAQNTSDTKQGIETTRPWDIIVSRRNGQPVPFTRYGQTHTNPEFEKGMLAGPERLGTIHLSTVPPGEVKSYRLQLDRWVDMTEEGEYIVRLRRWAGDPIELPGKPVDPSQKPRIITSPAITVTVKSTNGRNLWDFNVEDEILREQELPKNFGNRHPSTEFRWLNGR